MRRTFVSYFLEFQFQTLELSLSLIEEAREKIKKKMVKAVDLRGARELGNPMKRDKKPYQGLAEILRLHSVQMPLQQFTRGKSVFLDAFTHGGSFRWHQLKAPTSHGPPLVNSFCAHACSSDTCEIASLFLPSSFHSFPFVKRSKEHAWSIY
jgi:hypothetical protein